MGRRQNQARTPRSTRAGDSRLLSSGGAPHGREPAATPDCDQFRSTPQEWHPAGPSSVSPCGPSCALPSKFSALRSPYRQRPGHLSMAPEGRLLISEEIRPVGSPWVQRETSAATCNRSDSVSAASAGILWRERSRRPFVVAGELTQTLSQTLGMQIGQKGGVGSDEGVITIRKKVTLVR